MLGQEENGKSFFLSYFIVSLSVTLIWMRMFLITLL